MGQYQICALTLDVFKFGPLFFNLRYRPWDGASLQPACTPYFSLNVVYDSTIGPGMEPACTPYFSLNEVYDSKRPTGPKSRAFMEN